MTTRNQMIMATQAMMTVANHAAEMSSCFAVFDACACAKSAHGLIHGPLSKKGARSRTVWRVILANHKRHQAFYHIAAAGLYVQAVKA